MCASPLSPRHAQPDWMGGGLVSRQMMHTPPSAAIPLSRGDRRKGRRIFVRESQLQVEWPREKNGLAHLWTAALLVSARPEGGAGAVASWPQHALRRRGRLGC
jgi:hypothetical protein